MPSSSPKSLDRLVVTLSLAASLLFVPNPEPTSESRYSPTSTVSEIKEGECRNRYFWRCWQTIQYILHHSLTFSERHRRSIFGSAPTADSHLRLSSWPGVGPKYRLQNMYNIQQLDNRSLV